MASFTYIDEKYIKLLSSYLDRFKDVGNNTYNCRCIYCGDSQKSLLKQTTFSIFNLVHFSVATILYIP